MQRIWAHKIIFRNKVVLASWKMIFKQPIPHIVTMINYKKLYPVVSTIYRQIMKNSLCYRGHRTPRNEKATGTEKPDGWRGIGIVSWTADGLSPSEHDRDHRFPTFRRRHSCQNKNNIDSIVIEMQITFKKYLVGYARSTLITTFRFN